MFREAGKEFIGKKRKFIQEDDLEEEELRKLNKLKKKYLGNMETTFERL